MTREELEDKLIRRLGRTFTDQEKRILALLDEGDEEAFAALQSQGFWVEQRQSFPWMRTILAAAAAESALAVLPASADDILRESVLTATQQMAREAAQGLIKDITDSQSAAISEALDKWFAGEVDRAGFEALIASEFSPERAVRIGVTEATRISTAGQMEAAHDLQERGFDVHYIFHQRSDYEGCGCDDLDGHEVGLDEYDKHPPIHVNCNCELELVINEQVKVFRAELMHKEPRRAELS